MPLDQGQLTNLAEHDPDEYFAECILAMPKRDRRKLFRDFDMWDDGLKNAVEQQRLIAKMIYTVFIAPGLGEQAA